jgi:Tfp pilus assembly protein PilF
MTCVKLNLAQEAYESLKKAVTLDPSNAYYNYAFGAVALQREDPRESIPHFRRYCALKPADPWGRLALGTAYFHSHDDDAARKELEPLVRYPATAAGAHYFLRRIANREGDLGLAARELHQALQIAPHYSNAQTELGLVEMKQRDYVEAGRLLREALTIEPNNYAANLNLTILYQRTKDPRAAQQTQRLQQVQNEREQRAKELLRAIVVQRY